MSGEKKGLFGRLRQGLSKTRDQIVSGMDAIFNGASEIDDDFYEELEEVLIMGDVGIRTTERIIERLKEVVKEQRIKDPIACRQVLVDTLEEQMQVKQASMNRFSVYESQKVVILIVGVNGVGKTTSVGKLASHLKGNGQKVLLAAADTFRAAATEQLVEWSNRAGVDVITGMEGSDPSSIVYDALQAAKARNVDVLICDTAGRLHNKKNLMNELDKMDRIISKEWPEAKRESLIVLDATTGQNALNQAREFSQISDLSGIILTKMDGTAKGGIAIAIQSELQIPVTYIGVGEKVEDLQKFQAREFVQALFQQESLDSKEEEESIC